MRRDRTIQLIAAVMALAMFAGAATLSVPILDKQEELQLRYATTLDKEAPPTVQLAVAAGGLARGLLVQYLWYRANEMKEAGQFYEADTLSQWITTLQPRFPQVWAFRAWDMAYNISVATHTPAERWDWVRKGIRLLRDEGIPYNPRAARLYRELAWIFIHKIGQFTDDMHWYYKRQLAMEWQEVMGAPTVGATTAQVIANFKKIVDSPDKLDALITQHSDVGELVSKLGAINRTPGESLLREINRVYMYNYAAPQTLPEMKQVAHYRQLYGSDLIDILHDEKNVAAIETLLEFMQKQVLRKTYHMDPSYMLTIMERFGPMDWRHPAAHSAYWGSLGVGMAESLREKWEVDVINTHRLVIHSMQLLMRGGDLVFDPVTGYYDQTPDVRFIPAYELAFDKGRELVESGDYISGTELSFKKGHENFLMNAMVYEYYYGDIAQAQRLFDKARKLYGQETYNTDTQRYNRTLRDMVIFEQMDNIQTMQGARQAIDGFLTQAFLKGMMNGRMKVYDQFVESAKTVYDEWTSGKQKTINVTADQGRMIFGNWPEPLDSGFIRMLRSTQFPLDLKLRLWNQASSFAPDLPLHAYDQVKSALFEQLTAAGYQNPQAILPPPPGIEAYRASKGTPDAPQKDLESPLESDTGKVQRQ